MTRKAPEMQRQPGARRWYVKFDHEKTANACAESTLRVVEKPKSAQKRPKSRSNAQNACAQAAAARRTSSASGSRGSSNAQKKRKSAVLADGYESDENHPPIIFQQDKEVDESTEAKKLLDVKRPEDNHGAEDRNIPLHYATVPGCRVETEVNARLGAGRSTSWDPQCLG